MTYLDFLTLHALGIGGAVWVGLLVGAAIWFAKEASDD